MPANRNEIHRMPGATIVISFWSVRKSAKEKLKMIITSKEKIIIEFSICFVRNSVLRSFHAICRA